jgi:hypothetical protein
MMPRRKPPCGPKLHAILESYFSGPSIKSCAAITGRSSTDPTALKRVEVNAEVSKLMRNLSTEEIEELRGYYENTHAAEVALRRATMHRKRRKFRTAIAEVERAYNDVKKPGH